MTRTWRKTLIAVIMTSVVAVATVAARPRALAAPREDPAQATGAVAGRPTPATDSNGWPGPRAEMPRLALTDPSPQAPALGPPVPGAVVVVRPFDPPDQPWQAGHRGVDVAAPPGSPVLATADGTVSFAGAVAGRGVLVVDHGGTRTTYEPVTALVPRGTSVRAGQTVARLATGHDCGTPEVTCLHVGLKRGESYLEPVFAAGAANNLRLLPLDAAPGIRDRARKRQQAAQSATVDDGGPAPAPGSSGLIRPAAGPVTSRFGMRRHPVLGVTKLHDGVDFGLPCGAPLRSTAAGQVTQAYFNTGYGHRLFIDHGRVNGRHLVSSYNHATRYTVAPGEQVDAGQVIGLNGTTGYSTGCHLHFMLWADGRLVDPEPWL